MCLCVYVAVSVVVVSVAVVSVSVAAAVAVSASVSVVVSAPVPVLCARMCVYLSGEAIGSLCPRLFFPNLSMNVCGGCALALYLSSA